MKNLSVDTPVIVISYNSEYVSAPNLSLYGLRVALGAQRAWWATGARYRWPSARERGIPRLPGGLARFLDGETGTARAPRLRHSVMITIALVAEYGFGGDEEKALAEASDLESRIRLGDSASAILASQPCGHASPIREPKQE